MIGDGVDAVRDWLFHASVAEWEMRLVYAAALPQTLFVLGFGLRNTWWTSLLGWGQFTKALAMGLLLDMTVWADIAGPPPHAEALTFAIVILILVGAWLQCLAWVLDRRNERVERADPDLYA